MIREATIISIFRSEGIPMVQAETANGDRFLNPARNLRNVYLGARVHVAENGLLSSPAWERDGR